MPKGRKPKYPDDLVSAAKWLKQMGYQPKQMLSVTGFENVPRDVLSDWLTRGMRKSVEPATTHARTILGDYETNQIIHKKLKTFIDMGVMDDAYAAETISYYSSKKESQQKQ